MDADRDLRAQLETDAELCERYCSEQENAQDRGLVGDDIDLAADAAVRSWIAQGRPTE